MCLQCRANIIPSGEFEGQALGGGTCKELGLCAVRGLRAEGGLAGGPSVWRKPRQLRESEGGLDSGTNDKLGKTRARGREAAKVTDAGLGTAHGGRRSGCGSPPGCTATPGCRQELCPSVPPAWGRDANNTGP